MSTQPNLADLRVALLPAGSQDSQTRLHASNGRVINSSSFEVVAPGADSKDRSEQKPSTKKRQQEFSFAVKKFLEELEITDLVQREVVAGRISIEALNVLEDLPFSLKLVRAAKCEPVIRLGLCLCLSEQGIEEDDDLHANKSRCARLTEWFKGFYKNSMYFGAGGTSVPLRSKRQIKTAYAGRGLLDNFVMVFLIVTPLTILAFVIADIVDIKRHPDRAYDTTLETIVLRRGEISKSFTGLTLLEAWVQALMLAPAAAYGLLMSAFGWFTQTKEAGNGEKWRKVLERSHIDRNILIDTLRAVKPFDKQNYALFYLAWRLITENNLDLTERLRYLDEIIKFFRESRSFTQSQAMSTLVDILGIRFKELKRLHRRGEDPRFIVELLIQMSKVFTALTDAADNYFIKKTTESPEEQKQLQLEEQPLESDQNDSGSCEKCKPQCCSSGNCEKCCLTRVVSSVTSYLAPLYRYLSANHAVRYLGRDQFMHSFAEYLEKEKKKGKCCSECGSFTGAALKYSRDYLKDTASLKTVKSIYYLWLWETLVIYGVAKYLEAVIDGYLQRRDLARQEAACHADNWLWLLMEYFGAPECTACGNLRLSYNEVFSFITCVLGSSRLPQKEDDLVDLYQRIRPSVNISRLSFSAQELFNSTLLARALPLVASNMPGLRELNITSIFRPAGTISPNATLAVVDYLEEAESLTRLDLSGLRLGLNPESMMKAFFKALQNAHSLKVLDLTDNNLHGHMKELAAILRKLENLEVLELNLNDLDDQDLRDLAAGIPGTTFTKLFLGGNKISNIAPLGDVLRASKIQELHLWDNLINGLKGFAEGAEGSDLRVLNLDLNLVDDDGLNDLSASLPKCQKLTQLSLLHNQITNPENLFAALPFSPLEKLVLRYNFITGETLAGLKDLPPNRLIELDLGRNPLGANGTAHFAQGQWPHLKKLFFDNCETGEDVGVFAEWLRKNTKLEELVFSNNGLGDKGFVLLLRGLGTLLAAHLESNKITAVGMKAVEDVGFGKLKKVHLSFNPLKSGVKSLSKVVKDLGEVYLVEVGMGSEEAQELGPAIADSTVYLLTISRNEMGIEGARGMAPALTQLRTFFANDCGLNATAAEELLAYLPDSETLENLYLDDNPMVDIPKNLPGKTVKELSLSRCRLKDKKAIDFVNRIPDSVLEVLNLSFNELTDLFANAFAQASLPPGNFDPRNIVNVLNDRFWRRATAHLGTRFRYLRVADFFTNLIEAQGIISICSVQPQTHLSMDPYLGLNIYGNEIPPNVDPRTCQISAGHHRAKPWHIFQVASDVVEGVKGAARTVASSVATNVKAMGNGIKERAKGFFGRIFSSSKTASADTVTQQQTRRLDTAVLQNVTQVNTTNSSSLDPFARLNAPPQYMGNQTPDSQPPPAFNGNFGNNGTPVDYEYFRRLTENLESLKTIVSLIPVMPAVARTVSKELGWFEHKRLTPKAKEQCENELKDILDDWTQLLDEIEEHPILKLRPEYRLAKAAYEQARHFFEFCFEDANVTVGDAEKVCDLMKAVKHELAKLEEIEKQIESQPGFIQKIAELEKEVKAAEKTLNELQIATARKIKALKKQQERISDILVRDDIKPEDEKRLSEQFDVLETQIKRELRRSEDIERIFDIPLLLLKNINEVLASGCLPRDVDKVREKLDRLNPLLGKIKLFLEVTGRDCVRSQDFMGLTPPVRTARSRPSETRSVHTTFFAPVVPQIPVPTNDALALSSMMQSKILRPVGVAPRFVSS